MTTRRDPADDAAAARLCKTVDLGAVRANVDVLRAAAGGRRVMAVVKGDAYGLGAPAVGAALLDAGADALAVDTVAEGVALRGHGVRGPVLVMDVDVADNTGLYAEHGLLPTVATEEQVRRHAADARRRGAPVTVWLRTNIGFNRFGPRDGAGFEAVLEALRREGPAVRTAAVFAHLSSSAADPVETAEQARTFKARVAAARDVLGPGVESSLAATHGLLHPETLADTAWVRPGIGLYGVVASESRELPGWEASGLAALRPAVSVRARVLEVVTLTRAEGLGYDRSPVPAGRLVASVAVGFSRGLHSVQGELTGIVRGRSCPMVGRPGMDCAQFDVTDVPGARPGDWLTLLGDPPDGDGGGIAAGTVCARLGRSPYELLSTWRMPVRHVHPVREGAPAT